jgi:hypothetical protein
MVVIRLPYRGAPGTQIPPMCLRRIGRGRFAAERLSPEPIGGRDMALPNHAPRRPRLTRRTLLASAAGTALALATGGDRLGGAAPALAGEANLANPYAHAAFLLPWGFRSHWFDAWRSSFETVPASTFVDGLGMNLNLRGQSPALVLRMLGSRGIRHARLEIGWRNVTWNEDGFTNVLELADQLRACKAHGIRPLILLNANHVLPCPVQTVTRTVAAAAGAGATTLTLDVTTGLVVGRSGLMKDVLADILVTAVSGGTVTLSRPLPIAVPAGASLTFSTLKYRPFSVPGSADYYETMAGWLRYVDLVRRGVTDALGTAAAADKGFDLEIWNELTFGSAFLSINNYYAGAPYRFDEGAITRDLVAATAALVAADPAGYAGVAVSDGFASTTPWQAAATTPARVGALSKHPYPPRLQFPADEQKHVVGINALGQSATYSPTYAARFPEYHLTGIQTETALRDMGPITNLVGGAAHGRNARPSGRVDVWVTEVNLAPVWMDPWIGRDAALALKAKTSARFAAFFLHKGARRVYFYGATGAHSNPDPSVAGDRDVGMVLDAFLAHAAQPGATYPADDAADTSPALAVLGRMVAQFSIGLDRGLTTTRPLSVASISDVHNHAQFAGDGTAAHPPLYDREVLAILPFQVNARRFVIPYYVVTRDVLRALAPEEFTVKIDGLRGAGATVTAYDPIRDTAVPVAVVAASQSSLTVRVTATDSPCLLTVEEPFA